MTPDQIRELIASGRDSNITIDWDRSDLYTYAQQLADTLEVLLTENQRQREKLATTLTRLEAAERVCEISECARDPQASSLGEALKLENKIHSALEKWRRIKGGDGE